MFQISTKLKTSKYLSHVWILELQSGICLFERQYKAKSIDADLISGFLTAMRTFGEEIAHSLMEEINFQNMKFAITLGKHIMVVCGLTEDAPKGGAKGLLDIIRFEFEMRFHDYLEHFSGYCDIFLPFGEFLDTFLNKQPKSPSSNPSIQKEENNLKIDNPEEVKIKEAMMDGFKRRMEERQKGTWLTNYVRRKVKAQYEQEMASPIKLIRIHKNRNLMRQERHRAIGYQTRLMQQIVQKECHYLESFPPDQLRTLVEIREKEDRKKLMKQRKARNIKIQKITTKIQKLQDKLSRLN